MGQQESPLPHPRGSQCGLGASVATTNDYNVQFLREKHGKNRAERAQIIPQRVVAGERRAVFHVEQQGIDGSTWNKFALFAHAELGEDFTEQVVSSELARNLRQRELREAKLLCGQF